MITRSRSRRARTPRRPSTVPATVHRLSAALAAATVLAQVAYPLADTGTLRWLTVATVLLFAGASTLHAAATRGVLWAASMVLLTAGISLAAEVVGVRTGAPFGDYEYASTLGPKVLDVPVVVPLAWVMMAYPCLLLGRRLSRAAARRGRRATPSMVVTVLTAAFTLASWDLFLDPQMVAAGHWRWHDPTPALPGVPGVPLTNYAGWIAVSLVLMIVLDLLLPVGRREPQRASEGVPGALLTWTWLGSTVGNAVFFDRPDVAWWGGIVMGVLVVPYLYSWWDGRP